MPVDRAEARAVVDATIQDVLFMLRLCDWGVVIEWGHYEDVRGICWAHPKYRRATIRIDNDNSSDLDDLLRCVRHELLHIMHASWQTYRAAVSQAMTAQEDRITDELFQLAAEETVGNLERMLDALGLDYATLAARGRDDRLGRAQQTLERARADE